MYSACCGSGRRDLIRDNFHIFTWELNYCIPMGGSSERGSCFMIFRSGSSDRCSRSGKILISYFE